MISQLSAKYQYGEIHTADTTDGKSHEFGPFVHRIRHSSPFILAPCYVQLLASTAHRSV